MISVVNKTKMFPLKLIEHTCSTQENYWTPRGTLIQFTKIYTQTNSSIRLSDRNKEKYPRICWFSCDTLL